MSVRPAVSGRHEQPGARGCDGMAEGDVEMPIGWTVGGAPARWIGGRRAQSGSRRCADRVLQPATSCPPPRSPCSSGNTSSPRCLLGGIAPRCSAHPVAPPARSGPSLPVRTSYGSDGGSHTLRFGGLLLRSCHVETLPGVLEPRDVSLDLHRPNVPTSADGVQPVTSVKFAVGTV